MIIHFTIIHKRREEPGETNDAVYKKLNIGKAFLYKSDESVVLRPAFKNRVTVSWVFFVLFYKRVNSSHLFTLFTISKRY